MARNRVEFIITSEDGKAIQQLNKLLDKSREMGTALENSTEKGKRGFGEMGSEITDIIGGLAAFGTSMQIVNELIDGMRDKMKGVRDEMERTGESSRNYTEAIGRLLANMPGESQDTVVKIDEQLRKIVGGSAIGKGGLARITDAMTTVQSSIPLMPMDTKLDVIREVAQQLSLEPTADASGVALGYAKLLEANPELTANQAQNLLTTQQSLGLVKDVGKVSAMIPQLGTAAREAKIPISDMQALAAFATQVVGDTEGAQTTTLLGSFASKIMNQTDKVRELTGLQLSGNLLERFQQITDARSSGNIDDATWSQLMPVVGAEGVAGRMFMSSLSDPSRQKQLADTLAAMRNESVFAGDMVADLIKVKMAVPGARADADLRKFQSEAEALRAGDSAMASAFSETEMYKEQLQYMGRGDRFQEAAINRYTLLRSKGFSDAEARIQAENAGSRSYIPIFGSLFNSIDEAGVFYSDKYAKDLTFQLTTPDPLENLSDVLTQPIGRYMTSEQAEKTSKLLRAKAGFNEKEAEAIMFHEAAERVAKRLPKTRMNYQGDQ